MFDYPNKSSTPTNLTCVDYLVVNVLNVPKILRDTTV